MNTWFVEYLPGLKLNIFHINLVNTKNYKFGLKRSDSFREPTWQVQFLSAQHLRTHDMHIGVINVCSTINKDEEHINIMLQASRHP